MLGNLSAIQIVRTLNIFMTGQFLIVSNSSNTPVSNYFLTVQTKEEFTAVWNSLPVAVKKANTLVSFHNRCLKWLFES